MKQNSYLLLLASVLLGCMTTPLCAYGYGIDFHIGGTAVPELEVGSTQDFEDSFNIEREPELASPVRLDGPGPHVWRDTTAEPGKFYTYKAVSSPHGYDSGPVGYRVTWELALPKVFFVYGQMESGPLHSVVTHPTGSGGVGRVHAERRTRRSLICRKAGGETCFVFELSVVNGQKTFVCSPEKPVDLSQEILVEAPQNKSRTALARFEWDASTRYQGPVKRWRNGPPATHGVPMVTPTLVGSGRDARSWVGQQTSTLELWDKSKCRRTLHSALTAKLSNSVDMTLESARNVIVGHLIAVGYREGSIPTNAANSQIPPEPAQPTPLAIYKATFFKKTTIRNDCPYFNLPAEKPYRHGPPPGTSTWIEKSSGYGFVGAEGNIYAALRNKNGNVTEYTQISIPNPLTLVWSNAKGSPVGYALSHANSTYKYFFFGPRLTRSSRWNFDKLGLLDAGATGGPLYLLSRDHSWQSYSADYSPINAFGVIDQGAVAMTSFRSDLKLTLDIAKTKAAIAEGLSEAAVKLRCLELTKPFEKPDWLP